jgi:hypothetical protein
MSAANTQFDYLLNAFEHASQSDDPAKLGYSDKRKALIAYVRDLERRTLAAPEAPTEPVAWRQETESPTDKGWYAVMRADGSLCLRAFGQGLWWIPLKDGWLSGLPTGFKWCGPLADIDWMPPQAPEAQPAPRPSTPAGWSDTDWLAHLAACPPIGYAFRDPLYGTSKVGYLRICAADEPGAFAIYAAPHPSNSNAPIREASEARREDQPKSQASGSGSEAPARL